MRIASMAFLLCLMSARLGAQERLSFSRDVRPILSEHCFTCHGPDPEQRQANLRLDIAESALAERDGVRAIVPGNLEDSDLAYRIAADDAFEIMPPPDAKRPLSADQIAVLRRWILEGAAYADHWAFAPPRKPELPETRSATGNPVDAFIVSRLEEAGLTLAQPASKETLIRRVTLDLTGLTPTLDEIDAFLSDEDPRAFEKRVDALLPREQTAERLALDWLDVARYADTNGYSIDDHREMWAWRDWVIQAFRESKPYDAFIIEQLAGDLIPEATVSQKIATGFLRNAMNTHEGGTIAEEYRVASIVDKIDTVASAFMGLTLKCAQCHDHKYDPITQKEYYQLFALFNQSSEGGLGAQNGNTAPLLSLGEEWGGRPDVVAANERRAEHLIDYLRQLDGDRRRAWEAGQRVLLEEAGASRSPLERTAHEAFKAARAQWVWAPDVTEDDSLQVAQTFVLAAVPELAQLAISCDNHAEVFLNGQRLGRVDPWMKPFSADVSDQLRVGDNFLRVDAHNAGGVAGLLVALVDDRDAAILATTDAWSFHRTAPTDAALAPSGSMKVLGPYGAAPWGLFDSAPRKGVDVRKLLAVPEEERLFFQWQALLEDFAGSLEADDRTLLLRQLAAVEGELGLIGELLAARNSTVMVMDDASHRETHVLVRGQYDRPGEVITAGVPELLRWPRLAPVTNRLELARWLTHENHPLTARVTVNRYWQMLMGTGLVQTSEDFGSQGEWPSHPELLDWLAVSFVEHDWDLRWLLKTIVLSSTYQRSSRLTDELRDRDPTNRLLARSSRQRLPAELIRDNALHIAGMLSMRVGGPSVYPDQPDGLWRQVSHFGYSGFFSAQSFYPSLGADRYRRSMYTFWKRTAPPPALAAFDAPSREVCTVRRSRTNTPLQALVTLNEPQFMNAARALAERLVDVRGDRRQPAPPSISTAFRMCTGRRPTAAELDLLRGAFDRHLQHFRADPIAARALTRSRSSDDETVARQAAATMIASTLLNLDETMTRP